MVETPIHWPERKEAMRVFSFRVSLVLCLGMAAVPLFGLPAQDARPNQHFTGKVVPLADVPAKTRPKVDAESATHALVTEDNKVYPLLKDASSRMFAKDERLVNRPMRLTARLDPKTNMLQVINVHSLKNGKLHDVYYWCDICTIKGFEKGICDCCGGPMELRELPGK